MVDVQELRVEFETITARKETTMVKKFFGGLATLLLLASLFVWPTVSLAATHQQTTVTKQNVVPST